MLTHINMHMHMGKITHLRNHTSLLDQKIKLQACTMNDASHGMWQYYYINLVTPLTDLSQYYSGGVRKLCELRLLHLTLSLRARPISPSRVRDSPLHVW